MPPDFWYCWNPLSLVSNTTARASSGFDKRLLRDALFGLSIDAALFERLRSTTYKGPILQIQLISKAFYIDKKYILSF